MSRLALGLALGGEMVGGIRRRVYEQARPRGVAQGEENNAPKHLRIEGIDSILCAFFN